MAPVATSKVRIGIIGIGIIGKTHVAGYQPIPEAEIVAICDVREDEAQARCRAVQYPTCLHRLSRDAQAR